MTFNPVDIKALLAEVYMSNNFLWLSGARCFEPGERDYRKTPYRMTECEDINPGMFHLVLLNFIGRQKQTIIFDEGKNHKVWNYPISKAASMVINDNLSIEQANSLIGIKSKKNNYSFNREKNIVLWDVKTTLYFPQVTETEHEKNIVDLDRRTYRYILELTKEGKSLKVIGGEWTKASYDNHPDFLWMSLEPIKSKGGPDGANPNVDFKIVLDMWQESVTE